MSRMVTASGMSASAKVPSANFATPVNYMDPEIHQEALLQRVITHATTQESIYTIKLKKKIIAKRSFSSFNYSLGSFSRFSHVY